VLLPLLLQFRCARCICATTALPRPVFRHAPCHAMPFRSRISPWWMSRDSCHGLPAGRSMPPSPTPIVQDPGSIGIRTHHLPVARPSPHHPPLIPGAACASGSKGTRCRGSRCAACPLSAGRPATTNTISFCSPPMPISLECSCLSVSPCNARTAS
jgi:hypothetical protein